MRRLRTHSKISENRFEEVIGDKAILALARANIYNLLASAYAESPSVRLASALADGTLLHAFRYAGLSYMTPELEKLVLGRDIDEVLQGIEVEYARLFVVPGPDYIPPYQSLHCLKSDDSEPASSHYQGRLGKRQQLWGDAAVEAQRIYAEAGLSISGHLREVPDHIGLELQFMHHLCSREAEALSSRDVVLAEETVQLEMKFLDTLLLPWVNLFCQKVVEAALHPFYRAMATLTSAFVVSDAEEQRLLLDVTANAALKH